MRTHNVHWFPCSPARAFDLACQVDRWPELLPHYRRVRFHEGCPETGGTVEMAARRDFGPLSWPIWWVSRMAVDRPNGLVRYTHIDGVTAGMDVEWRLEANGTSTRVSIVHEWGGGPRFCGPAATTVGHRIVGPIFVYHVAAQTLAHLARHAREGITG